MNAGRVVLLLTSPRVAPGLLDWSAWQVLHAADRVLTADPTHPQRAAVEASGVAVETLDVAGDAPVARALVDEARTGRYVVWLAGDDEPGLGAALGQLLAGAAEAGEERLPELEVIPASYDIPGARLLDLVAVMDRLRTDCPWIVEQTHRSLVRYLLEEAYETVEAVETGDRDHLREELGDLLFQIVFHARIAEEDDAEPWSVDDVAGEIVEKLVRRHPHVFGDVEVSGVDEVEANWNALKAAEKGRASAVEGVPLGLPALTLAEKLLDRTARAGLEVQLPAPSGLPAQLDMDSLGDLLFGLVTAGRASGLDPEQALRDAIRRYVDAVRIAES